MTTYTKQYYRLSEVAEMLNIPASTINYWVYIFDELDPPTTKGGHRRYRPEDIELISRIRIMMHDKVMSIEGAKKQLKNSHAPYRGYRCEFAEDAIRLIGEVEKFVADNPKALAMLKSVQEWAEEVKCPRKNSKISRKK